MILYATVLFLLSICLAFQYVTAFMFLMFGRNTPYARFVENFYEHQPKDCINVFYIENYGLAISHYIKRE